MTDTPALAIFDLDGTLVDPAGSITGGIAYALEAHGLDVPTAAVLAGMVGPPLLESLHRLVDAPEGLLDAVVHTYRKQYIEHGMAQSLPYPGIPELLARLRERGLHLTVATQKPRNLAVKLLRLHGLERFFHSIHGSPDDETLPPPPDGKVGIVLDALVTNHATADRAVMIGDRRHDAAGAAANGVRCIGVAWGFAPEGEFASLDLAAIVSDADELERAIGMVLDLAPEASAC
ncbi:HAD hydrolase-like protein [Sinomonas sp. P10A9]|uniref:HAD hydrolase-like protein n=1 Tax=Sinomonas puerhi TaxID=3238584 RepID=A0AB39L864_9MICC